MARAAAAVASNGVLRDTRWEEIGSADSPGVQFLDADAARLLAGYMRDVVLNGTGRTLRGNAWHIAGKTGTAELSGKPSHSWFVGFAPFRSGHAADCVRGRRRERWLWGGQRRSGRWRDRRRGGARRAREDELTMDILGKARRLEARITARLDRAAKEFAGSGAREPLEIVHAILDIVEREIPAGQPRDAGVSVQPD
jgi:membrane peptidoglycan carboxypeptidase